MSSPKPKPVIVPGDGIEPPAPSLRSIVGKSALLNLMIVLTSGPVLLFAGGPRAVYPTLVIMAGITFLIWTATFALFSIASLPRLFRPPAAPPARRDSPLPAPEAGVADRWLDGPA